MIEYVLMTREHVPQIAELEKLCFSMPWSENSIAGEMNNALALWIVAIDGDKVAGYIGSQAVMGEADMMNVAVLPEYRRCGIGRELVTKLVEALKEKGNYCLTLEVRVSNEPAIRMYEALGFTKIGQRPNYYAKPREDALILRKEWQI